MDKYGFVYIWTDKGRNRYYIGARWGHINDGYICSSRWMKFSKSKRPEDFTRQIISYHKTKEELWEAEYQMLQTIPDEELGIRYYNKAIFKHQTTSPMKGKKVSELTKERQRQAKLNNPIKYWEGKKIPDDIKMKMSRAKLGKPSPRKGMTHTEESKEKNRQSHLGKKHSDQARKNMRNSIRKYKNNDNI